ncbi:hypothetical protein F8M41_026512 [Gigaspora margarita]|uniref:Uncharacterized protein n=1 Tax=Gigaspora margarita TaxID=4874 RepID=A0A8H3XIA3_GIGMA|nr:hypothetical protein F8M41_026512 [Gigaspora margarita]
MEMQIVDLGKKTMKLCRLGKIFTTSISAQSGVVLLPPYDGKWYNCTTDITNLSNQKFTIKLVDNSTPVTTGFGINLQGNSSYIRIHGTGFSLFSVVDSTIISDTLTGIDLSSWENETTYCGTYKSVTTQCDSPFSGLPSPKQNDRQWCLFISNPFNNSQKAQVSFLNDKTDKTSTNVTKIDKSVSGLANNINYNYPLLILLLLIQMLWKYFY